MTFNDIIEQRLKRIVDLKGEENAEALGKLKKLGDGWDNLSQSFDDEIKTEFDRVDEDDRIINKVITLLKKNICVPDRKDVFTIAGKAIDPETEIGLPDLSVKVFVPQGKKELLLKEVQTNSYGNFSVKLEREILDKFSGKLSSLTFKFFSDDETLVHNEDVKFVFKLEKIAEITIKIPCGSDLLDRVEAGKSLRDSVITEMEQVRNRKENMRAADTSIKNLNYITFKEIQTLINELSAQIPEITLADTEAAGTTIETISTPIELPDSKDIPAFESPGSGSGKQPEKNKKKGKTPEIKTGISELEDISGIGSVRAENLRNNGIKTIKSFLESSETRLKKILGNLNFKKMKDEITGN